MGAGQFITDRLWESGQLNNIFRFLSAGVVRSCFVSCSSVAHVESHCTRTPVLLGPATTLREARLWSSVFRSPESRGRSERWRAACRAIRFSSAPAHSRLVFTRFP